MDGEQPGLLHNLWADATGPDGVRRRICRCVEPNSPKPTHFHPDRQDTTAPGWLHLLDLIEEAAADGREVFKPLVDLTAEERAQVVTLPPSIARLTAVKHLVLYGSDLVRIPAEIGAMRELEEFSPYTSYRLHWFPYELSRLPKLRMSTVSTRAIYGNRKHRPHFPALRAAATPGTDLTDLDPAVWGTTEVRACSVCDGPVEATALRQVWISLHTSGADVLPLLVNACSPACVEALPDGAEGHVPTPHRGGPDVKQPSAGRTPR